MLYPEFRGKFTLSFLLSLKNRESECALCGYLRHLHTLKNHRNIHTENVRPLTRYVPKDISESTIGFSGNAMKNRICFISRKSGVPGIVRPFIIS